MIGCDVGVIWKLENEPVTLTKASLVHVSRNHTGVINNFNGELVVKPPEEFMESKRGEDEWQSIIVLQAAKNKHGTTQVFVFSPKTIFNNYKCVVTVVN